MIQRICEICNKQFVADTSDQKICHVCCKTIQHKEGVKYDQEKARYDLIPGYALDELVKIYTYGARKYADDNWRRGMKWRRIFGALMRHSWAWFRGEDIDSESGLNHMAHAAWSCFTLIEYQKMYREGDDRVKDLPKIEENT